MPGRNRESQVGQGQQVDVQHASHVFRICVFNLSDDACAGIIDQQFDLHSEASDFFVQQSPGFWFSKVDGNDMAACAVSGIQIGGQSRHAIFAACGEDQVHSATGELQLQTRPDPGRCAVISGQRSL
jgi:hypothetical protein